MGPGRRLPKAAKAQGPGQLATGTGAAGRETGHRISHHQIRARADGPGADHRRSPPPRPAGPHRGPARTVLALERFPREGLPRVGIFGQRRDGPHRALGSRLPEAVSNGHLDRDRRPGHHRHALGRHEEGGRKRFAT